MTMTAFETANAVANVAVPALCVIVWASGRIANFLEPGPTKTFDLEREMSKNGVLRERVADLERELARKTAEADHPPYVIQSPPIPPPTPRTDIDVHTGPWTAQQGIAIQHQPVPWPQRHWSLPPIPTSESPS